MRTLLSRMSPSIQQFQRWLLVLTVVLFGIQLWAFPANATSLYEIPSLEENTWIVDKADVISRSNEGKLSSMFADLAKQTGYEVRVVTLHRLDYDETTQGFADKLFTQWYPEPEEQQNQVLLVLDNVTNTSGIRVGDKAKSILTDAIATSVAQESLLIPLKEDNKYNQAFVSTGDRLVALLSGKADPGAPQLKNDVMVEGTFATKEDTKESNATVWVIGFLIAATIIPMATYYFYQYMGSR